MRTETDTSLCLEATQKKGHNLSKKTVQRKSPQMWQERRVLEFLSSLLGFLRFVVFTEPPTPQTHEQPLSVSGVMET